MLDGVCLRPVKARHGIRSSSSDCQVQLQSCLAHKQYPAIGRHVLLQQQNTPARHGRL